MEPSWHRVSITLLDRDPREGTISVFFDYNLGNWIIGPRVEVDPCWLDLNIDFGPIAISFVYWRRRERDNQ